MDEVNDLTVTCRVVSTHGNLTNIKVRIIVEDDKNFTIDTNLQPHKEYTDDTSYGVSVVPHESSVRIQYV